MTQLKTSSTSSLARLMTQRAAAIAGVVSFAAISSAHGQCNCTCDAIVPTNQQIISAMLNEDGSSPTHMVSASGPRNLAREVRHGNRFIGGMTITHVCIALESPTGQPGEIGHVQFYQPDPDPINMGLPGAMMYDQQFQISPGINGHQIVQLVAPQHMTAEFWVVVAYPTAQPSIGHQGTRPRTSGESAVYIGGPSLPPPHNYTPGWRYYDDMGGPGGTSGYFLNAPIIRPLNIGPSGSACPHDAQCCADVCAIDPSCCSMWHPLCNDLALQTCFSTGCAGCPTHGIDEGEACGTDINGGCDTNMNFSTITCNTVVCGTLWLDNTGIQDTDWYILDVVDLDGDGMSFVTFNVESEVPIAVLLQSMDCPNDVHWVAYTGEHMLSCIPAVFGGAVPSPGQFRISVHPLGHPGTCVEPRHYTMWVDVDDCPGANPPINNDCADAGTVILHAGQHFSFENFDATTDGPAETCGFTGVDDADVWFTYIAPCDGAVTFELISADHPDYMLAAYTACPSVGGVLINCDSASVGGTASFDVPMAAGETILLRMGAANNAQGVATIYVDSPSACVTDINGDCVVDVSDLLILLSSWGSCPDPTNCPADLNFDHVVDVSDLLLLLSTWGPC